MSIQGVKDYFFKYFSTYWQERDGTVVGFFLPAVLFMNRLDIGKFPLRRETPSVQAFIENQTEGFCNFLWT